MIGNDGADQPHGDYHDCSSCYNDSIRNSALLSSTSTSTDNCLLFKDRVVTLLPATTTTTSY